jgi:hypothetical protein
VGEGEGATLGGASATGIEGAGEGPSCAELEHAASAKLEISRRAIRLRGGRIPRLSACARRTTLPHPATIWLEREWRNLADAPDLGSGGRKAVGVQIPPLAPLLTCGSFSAGVGGPGPECPFLLTLAHRNLVALLAWRAAAAIQGGEGR